MLMNYKYKLNSAIPFIFNILYIHNKIEIQL